MAINLNSQETFTVLAALKDYRIQVSRGPWDAEPMKEMLAEIDGIILRYERSYAALERIGR